MYQFGTLALLRTCEHNFLHLPSFLAKRKSSLANPLLFSHHDVLPWAIHALLTWPSCPTFHIRFSYLSLYITFFNEHGLENLSIFPQGISPWCSSFWLNTSNTTLFLLGLWINSMSIKANVSTLRKKSRFSTMVLITFHYILKLKTLLPTVKCFFQPKMLFYTTYQNT
jgi:hypothetical protein